MVLLHVTNVFDDLLDDNMDPKLAADTGEILKREVDTLAMVVRI